MQNNPYWQDLDHEAQFGLYSETVNPQLTKVLRTIGFDRQYVRAQGAYLFDAKGDRYLDCLAGYGVFNVGRNHPRVKDALKAAIDADLPNMVQMDAPSLAGQLARKLLGLINVQQIDTVFFTNSGTEAVEGALKFARCKTKRPRVIHCDHAFHGLTNGSLSCNGNAEFRNGFEPLLPGFHSVPFGDLVALEESLKLRDVAAFIVEPIQGKGVYTQPSTYFDEAIKLCHKYGTLVIVDEIQTGFGRTGKWFAYQAWEQQPDIVCVAKGLSGGMIPVGAICYPRSVYNAVYSSMERCVVHSNTFGRNTLAMVAGLTSLQILEDEKLIENSRIQGAKILESFRALAKEFEMIREVRGDGLMIGIEFGRPKSFGLRTGWDLINRVNKSLFGQLIVVPLMRDHKILTQVAGHNTIVKLLPSLTLNDSDVEWLLRAFREVCENCHTFPGSAWDVGKDLAKRALRA